MAQLVLDWDEREMQIYGNWDDEREDCPFWVLVPQSPIYPNSKHGTPGDLRRGMLGLCRPETDVDCGEEDERCLKYINSEKVCVHFSLPVFMYHFYTCAKANTCICVQKNLSPHYMFWCSIMYYSAVVYSNVL